MGVGMIALLVCAACGQSAGANGGDVVAAADGEPQASDITQVDADVADSTTDAALSDGASQEVVDDAATDATEVPDAPDPDVQADGSDVAIDVPDSGLDAGTDAIDAAADASPDVPVTNCEFAANPSAGAAGATCAADADCSSGACANSPDGKRCAPACAGSCCPTGWTCDKTAITPICAPKWTSLCAPCTTDEQCAALTPGSLCIKHGATGSFCATPCAKTADCPTDYKCSFSYGVGSQSLVCVTQSACDCNAAAIAISAKTTCSNSNSAGSCKGERACGAGGLELCSALIPSPETCNGIDDDCNGQTDEGMADLDADGIPDCDDPDMDGDGVANSADCAVMDPKVFPGNSEKCNGADDNCDGKTDEGFNDSDSDGMADCIDLDLDGDGVANVQDCSPTDGGVFQGNTEICDGKDQNCNKKIDEGFADMDNDGVADCVDPDVDGDGVANAADCSPTDAKVFPGQQETCDGKDNSCDGKTDEGFPDLDKDGIADCVDPDIDGDTVDNEFDCSPTNGAIFPGAVEACNGVDDNCDGATDTGCDDDKDGYCDATLPVDPTSVGCPNGGGDCDDTKSAVHPDAAEICDALDNDCNGVTDPGCDKDGDGYCQGTTAVSSACPQGGGDCNDGDVQIHPGTLETCDNQDQNCDGKTDEGCDADGDGFCAQTTPADAKFAACPKGGGDCNDGDKFIHPGVLDPCNGKDDDCDGVIDPGCDSDGDGYCGGSVPVSAACVNGGNDCDDGNAAIHPNSPELCDDLDNDCANGVDDGCDADGDGWCAVGAVLVDSPAACKNGINDCSDKQASVHPGAPDICDGLDNGCNGKNDVNCDQDGDGYCDANRVTVGAPWICLWGGGDCDDHQVAVHPKQPEVCDLLDNDCDGKIDGGCDVDGDGYCANGQAFVVGSGACPLGGMDCDDLHPTVHPNGIEVCDDLDNDCNDETDFYCDEDGDGWCTSAMTTIGKPKICLQGGGDCDDAHVSVTPVHEELCDDLDNNCDGGVDTGCDDDGDKFCDTKMTIIGSPAVCPNGSGDCDDTKASIRPDGVEVCDGLDNNCKSGIDEGCNDDGDAFCDTVMVTVGTPPICPSGGGDCNDNSAQINPGLTEICDDLDNNCSNGVDEGCDDDKDLYCDGAMVTVGVPKICPYGPGDCNDLDPFIGASSTGGGCIEICDDVDNDNNGVTDELCDQDSDGYCDAGRMTVGKPKACLKGGGDCADKNSAVNPGQKELCLTAFDDNCDGLTDSDGAVGCTNYFTDNDNDGYGKDKVCYCSLPKPRQTFVGGAVDMTKAIKLAPMASDSSGVAFANNCPDGNIAVGVNGQFSFTTSYMVLFTLMCKKLNTDGTLGLPTNAPSSGVAGGPSFAATCPNDEVLTTQWGGQNGADPQHLYVSKLGGHCSTLMRIAMKAGGLDDPLPGSPVLFDGGGTTSETSCPVGYVVTGSYGHFSTWHGDFGYSCSPVTLTPTFQVFVTIAGDCNDNDASANPGATEQCDNIDNNCDAAIDESCDVDKDSYCTSAKTIIGFPTVCPKGGGDCNDAVGTIHPNVPDTCDGIDNDCNGVWDPGCDDDQDGYCDSNITTIGKPFTCPQGGGDCNDTNNAIHPNLTEACDDVDQNCDGAVDNGCDDDLDGYCDSGLAFVGAPKICGKGKGDCDDGKLAVNPGATEVCDNIDNNCSGKVDETCDDDGDGWCRLGATYVGTVSLCTKGTTDCNDAKATIYPGAPEQCDGLDNSCGGVVDKGCDDDNDKYCDSSMTYVGNSVCTKGGGDCNDSNASINPGAIDKCGNGIDDDCSGSGPMTAATQSQGTQQNPSNKYTSSSWLAFPFTPSVSGTLASINGLQMLRWSGNVVYTTLQIYSGGLPGAGGTKAGTTSQNVSETYNFGSHNFSLGGIAVTKGVTYYAVIFAGDSNYGYLYTNQGGNGAWTSSDSGANWSKAGTYPFSAIVTVSGIDGPTCQP